MAWTFHQNSSGYIEAMDKRMPNSACVQIYYEDRYRIERLDKLYLAGKLDETLSPIEWRRILRRSWLGLALWPFLIGATLRCNPYKQSKDSDKLREKYPDPHERESAFIRAERDLLANILTIIRGDPGYDLLISGSRGFIIEINNRITLFSPAWGHRTVPIIMTDSLACALFTIYTSHRGMIHTNIISGAPLEERLPHWEGSTVTRLTSESEEVLLREQSVPSPDLELLLKEDGVMYRDYYRIIKPIGGKTSRLYQFTDEDVFSYNEDDSRLIIENLAYHEQSPEEI